MALAFVPQVYALATVAAPGTSVAPSLAVPDNCHAYVLRNTGANPALCGTGVPGVALTGGVDAITLAAGGSLSIPLGDISVRGPMDQSQLAGSGLIFDATGGGTTVEILYMCTVGASG